MTLMRIWDICMKQTKTNKPGLGLDLDTRRSSGSVQLIPMLCSWSPTSHLDTLQTNRNFFTFQKFLQITVLKWPNFAFLFKNMAFPPEEEEWRTDRFPFSSLVLLKVSSSCSLLLLERLHKYKKQLITRRSVTLLLELHLLLCNVYVIPM